MRYDDTNELIQRLDGYNRSRSTTESVRGIVEVESTTADYGLDYGDVGSGNRIRFTFRADELSPEEARAVVGCVLFMSCGPVPVVGSEQHSQVLALRALEHRVVSNRERSKSD